MRQIIVVCLCVFFSWSAPVLSWSQDVRPMMRKISEEKKMLLERAIEEKHRAREELLSGVKEISKDRASLLSFLRRLKARKEALLTQAQELKSSIASLTREKQLLGSIMEKNHADIQELVGYIRINAKDLDGLLRQSPYSALYPHRERTLSSLLGSRGFPAMKDIENMVMLLFEELYLSGNVVYKRCPFIDRNGNTREGKVLFVGPFTQMYSTGKDVGFLLYSPASERFFALSRHAPYLIRRHIKRYLTGESSTVPVDIARGAAIRQFLYEPSLWENILSGGPLIWPILAIGVAGLFLIIERLLYLAKRSMDTSSFMEQLTSHIKKGEWDRAHGLCKGQQGKIIPAVVLTAIEHRGLAREDMENMLQERILGIIPSLEKFLSTLGMLAAIAPLLGLLGTVTGMINTFHVITYYGTSDPRLMSSGISEALITTMLGLSVAIPIMFFHTLISRRVDSLVAQMEECAVSVVNLIYARE